MRETGLMTEKKKTDVRVIDESVTSQISQDPRYNIAMMINVDGWQQ